MKLKPLKFVHKFASGRVVTLTVSRKENTLPVMASTGFKDLGGLERCDYLVWRANTVRALWGTLTEGEQQKCMEHGFKIARAKK